ncbi:MAG TPA: glycoside hydrolase [Candidatus Angelobacter sp.]|nr:glycoside hydrolase [Candidatus Angelobacter sp.]
MSALSLAQQPDPSLLQSLHWRGIGPYRGGRTKAAAGVPGKPSVFYVGVVNGGVWKTDDFGRTWTPIFDSQPTGSIGAVAVSISDPDVVYVGSGEGLHRPDLSVGDGIYKSTDGGKTWTHLGLRDGQQIPQIAIDPRDPNKLLVAVAGHPYGPNEERGIFRSTDGGQSFSKVLYKDENTGGADVQIDPTNPDTVYATLWEAREGPWENGAWNGTGGGIFKSTDGGRNWQPLTKGLPEGIVQANVTICAANPNRLYSSVATKTAVGIYRSDDGGQSWVQATTDPRPAGRIGGGDLSVPRVDPKNPDTVYVASTVTWKSTDGGKTWTGFRGAPGGDDYQNLWINPNNPEIILLTSDQGAIITVNGGQSWSSWYNQPTAQMYHVNADNAFPYRLCSGQQESGSACISSRGDGGQVTIREWHPVAAEEYGYVVPDPLDPDTIFGGKLTRYDRRTAQAQNIMPKPFRSQDFRVLRTEPILFSPHDPHTLYFASNVLWKTNDGGRSWQQISPDLTRKTFDVPATVGKFRNEPTAQAVQRGVIYAVAASPLEINRIWAGTDDGQIHLTTDGGKNWTNITPPGMTPFQKVSIIEASHFDAQTAYAAINTLRLDDMHAHILRTRDSGKSWTEIVNGIPNGEPVDAVREDPKRKGLLFAGTEHAVYVSFDDGEHWQSLRLNMPASSVRDVIIKNDDLVAATHGRGFWILDDITPLRQFDANVTTGSAFLFKPEMAYRVRWDLNTDTPLPPDFPAADNPPDGAVIDYYLKSTPSSAVTLEIRDAAGKVVRRYSSADPIEPTDPMLAIPAYWVRPPQRLSSAAGMHRFLWDMHYPPVRGIRPEYPIAAVPHNTAPQPTSPWAMPGQYTVVLTVNGKSYSQPLTVKMDLRVKTPTADLEKQFQLSQKLYRHLISLVPAANQLAGLRKQLDDLQKQAQGEVLTAVKALDHKLQAMAGGQGRRPGPGNEPPSLGGMRARLLTLHGVLQEVDAAPTSQATSAVGELEQQIPTLMQRWEAIKSQDVPALNTQLKRAGLPAIHLDANAEAESGDEE